MVGTAGIGVAPVWVIDMNEDLSYLDIQYFKIVS